MKTARLLAAVLLLLAAGACGPKRQPVPLYYAAESSLRRGDLQDAVTAYRLFLNNPGADGQPYVPRSYYMLALAYYRLGEYQDALAALDEIERVSPTAEWVQVWALRGDAEEKLGEPLKAIQSWDQSWRLANPMDRQRLQRRMNALLPTLGLPQLEQAAGAVHEPGIHELLAERIVALGGALIPDPAAMDPLPGPSEALGTEGSPLRRAPEPPAAGVSPAPIAPPAFAPVAPADRKIACLLPLTGPHREDGEDVLRAVRMAFDNAPERVIEYDAGESAMSARTAWAAIAANPQVLGVIAWLNDPAADEVNRLSSASRTPVVFLASRPAGESAYTRGWGISPAEEMERLVDYMVRDVHIRTFAALYPATPSGNDYLAAFRAAVERRGATLAGSQSFPPAQASWQREIERVRAWRSAKTNAVGAVLLAAGMREAAPLARAINSAFPDVLLLGTAGWVRGQRPPAAADLRAFVAGASAATPADPAGQAFVERYAADAGHPPGDIESDAYQAAAALRDAIAEDAVRTRTDLRARIADTERPSTATGQPRVLRLRGGTIEPVAAPAT